MKRGKVLRKSPSFSQPVKGIVTSAFGSRISPVKGNDEVHKGVDVAVPTGTCAIAADDGVVQEARWSDSYGYFLSYTTKSGYDILYAHLNELLVKKGDKINRGQVLAYTGSTGQSTGAHIHIELRKDKELVNPMDYLRVE